ncbi:unnamed protein product [Heterobilharzia americana]|nr:unnamed protein product [Heterobilharzia americana]
MLKRCGVCLSGLSFIHYLLTDPYWRDVYTLTAENICDLIPSGRTKDACSIYITKYLQVLWIQLEQLVNQMKFVRTSRYAIPVRLKNIQLKQKILTAKTSFTERMKRPIQSGCSLFMRQEQHCTDYMVDLLNHINKALYHHLDNICRRCHVDRSERLYEFKRIISKKEEWDIEKL